MGHQRHYCLKHPRSVRSMQGSCFSPTGRLSRRTSSVLNVGCPPFVAWEPGVMALCRHPVVSVLGGCCPIDISGSAGNSLYFYGSSVIQSIRTRRVSGVCRVDPAPWTDGVVVDFFAKPNGQCYIGSVGYGHVRNRVSDGVRNVRTLKIGELPPDCACSCSSGVHVHIQFTGSQIYVPSFSCYQWLYAGSTWICRWYWNEGWC